MRKLKERNFTIYAQPVSDDYYSDPSSKSYKTFGRSDEMELVGTARTPGEAQKIIKDFRDRNPDYEVWYELQNKYIIPIREDLEIKGTDIILEKGDKIEFITEMSDEEYTYKSFKEIEPELQDFYAKKLASEWYDGMNDPLYALVSTGAILRGVEDSIMNGIGDMDVRDFLINYVDDRGYRGPQPNWKYIRW